MLNIPVCYKNSINYKFCKYYSKYKTKSPINFCKKLSTTTFVFVCVCACVFVLLHLTLLLDPPESEMGGRKAERKKMGRLRWGWEQLEETLELLTDIFSRKKNNQILWS